MFNIIDILLTLTPMFLPDCCLALRYLLLFFKAWNAGWLPNQLIYTRFHNVFTTERTWNRLTNLGRFGFRDEGWLYRKKAIAGS